MKKIKLSEEEINELTEKAVDEYKERQWKDFKFGILIIVGLALYIYFYTKLGGIA